MDFFNTILGFGVIGTLLTVVVTPTLLREYVFRKYAVLITATITAVATIGSLFYSELFNLEPCPLCWYQRIFMFPIPLILVVAHIKKIKDVWHIVFPFSLIGLMLSMYQVFLQFGGSATSLFCEPGSIEACSIPYVKVFGFITIPVMAGSMFLLVAVVSWIMMRRDATE